MKTEGKCNESVNKFKIMRESNSLHQIMKVINNETNSPYSCLFFVFFLIRYIDIMNSLKSDKTHYILIE